LATSLASPPSLEAVRGDRQRRQRGFAALLVTALTMLAVAVHGYHPYAEDGGVYLPEIKRLLRPELYPQGAEYVVGHLRFSIFPQMMAVLVRASHMSVEMVLLLAHLASFWTTLFAAWLLAERCFASWVARSGAVALLAVWITLPIAGTSLMLMDPYVTARSFSTPCGLLAMVGALDFLLPQYGTAAERRRGLAVCFGALAAAAVMHPLMAAYALGCVLVLGCVMSGRRQVQVWGTLALCATAIAVAGALQMTAPQENEAYRVVVITRYYWFLSQWHWYEWLGLAAPLTILAVIGFRGRSFRRQEANDAARVGLARTAVVAGGTAVAVAMLFARENLATHLVARLQPLRIFQVVYVVMILMVGAVLAERVLRRSAMRWVVTFSLLAGVMVVVDQQTFPASAHVELPGRSGVAENAWEQAFVWISRNTPNDAVFALDAHYITSKGEDAQGFRAIAERSVLPDYSKDGGVVANRPAVTAAWMAGVKAQTNLNTETDAARMAALRPLGADWVVLDRGAKTGFRCDYANDVVKVCRLL